MNKLLSSVIAFTLLIFSPLSAADTLNLGILTTFQAFTGAGDVTNSSGVVNGDVGTNLGAAIGLELPSYTGDKYTGDAVAAQAKQDLLRMYIHLNDLPIDSTHAPAFGGGETITPGVYSIGGAGSIGTILNLDGQGDPNAFFVIQFNGAMTVGANSTVNLIGGTQSCNVFYVASGAINLAAGANVKGTLFSKGGAVGLGAGAILEGRILTMAGAVTMGLNSVSTPPACTSTIPIFCEADCNPAAAVDVLGVLSKFALYTSAGAIANTGITGIVGDIGGAGAITAYSSGSHIGSEVITELAAKTALDNAYTALMALPVTGTHAAAFGLGETLFAGVYDMAAGSLGGTITLDAQDDPEAIFLMRFAGAFNVAAAARIILANGAKRCNIFWLGGAGVATGAVNIGASAVVKGNFFSHGGASNSGASVFLAGRQLSTGGAVNTNASVIYTNPQCVSSTPLSGGLDHLQIEHASGSGLTCAASTLTIRACADAACTPYSNGVVGTLSTTGSPTVNWDGSTGGASGAGFVIENGSSSVTKKVQVTTVGDTTFAANALVPVASNVTRCNFGSPSCTFTANDSGFIFDVLDHVAEVQQTVSVRAFKKADNSLACTPAFVDVSKNLALTCAYTNPVSGTLPLRVNNSALNVGNDISTACDAGGQIVNLAFDTNGVASASVQYADVGQLSLSALYTGNVEDSGLVMTGSDAFTVAPKEFAFSAITTGPIIAGDNFSATVSAINAAGIITPNFGQEVPSESVILTLGERMQPSGINNCVDGPCDGGVSGGVGSWSYGVATATNISYSEVGTMNLSASLATSDYMASGLTVFGTSTEIGTFIPAYFDTAVTPGCSSSALSSSFTYSDQPFKVEVTAKNLSAVTTVNYSNFAGCDQCAKVVTLSDLLSTTNFKNNVLNEVDFARGIGSSDTVTYTFPGVTTEPVTIKLRAANTVTTSENKIEDSTVIRSGRVRLLNAFGSELLALPVPIALEYYASNGWQNNDQDTCTIINASDFTFTFPNGSASKLNNLSACETAMTVSVSGTAPNPHYTLALNQPVPTSIGWTDIALNLGDLGGNTCTAPGAGGESATSVNAPWLQYNWTGVRGNPKSRAMFGVYQSTPSEVVHRLERY